MIVDALEQESAKFIPHSKPRTIRVNGTLSDLGTKVGKKKSEKFWAKVNEYQDKAVIKSLCYRTGEESYDSNLTGLIDYEHLRDLDVTIAFEKRRKTRGWLDKLCTNEI